MLQTEQCSEHTVVILEQLVASQHHIKRTPKQLSGTQFFSVFDKFSPPTFLLLMFPLEGKRHFKIYFQINHFTTQLENTSSLFRFRQYFFRRLMKLSHKYIVVALNQHPVKMVIQFQQEFCSCRAANQYCISPWIALPFLKNNKV